MAALRTKPKPGQRLSSFARIAKQQQAHHRGDDGGVRLGVGYGFSLSIRPNFCRSSGDRLRIAAARAVSRASEAVGMALVQTLVQTGGGGDVSADAVTSWN